LSRTDPWRASANNQNQKRALSASKLNKMGKRRPNDAGLEDQDPYAARMNAGASFSLGSTSGFGGGGAAGAVAGEGASRGMLFVHHLRALNDQFAVWVKQRVAEHPLEPMTSGVIDYLAHLKQVRRSITAKRILSVHLIQLDTSSAASLL
jgi:cation diffusion facilitator CzcD-associated flavoprotein CzcO